jgi:hypothetical protein
MTGLQKTIPDFRDLTLRDGFDDARRLGVRFHNVALDAPSPIAARLADLEMRSGNPNSCAGKFIPMPRKGVIP